MNTFPEFRRAAIRYWEWRRIAYNLALIPPAFFGYLLADYFNYAGQPHSSHNFYLFALLIAFSIPANFVYTFAYAVEFLLGSDDPRSRWLRFGRTLTFVAGVLLGMLLALAGGKDIADVAYNNVW